MSRRVGCLPVPELCRSGGPQVGRFSVGAKQGNVQGTQRPQTSNLETA